MRTLHYPNCEDATSRTCRCAWCAGTRHGWLGAISLATNVDASDYEDYRSRAEDHWTAALAKQKDRRNKRPTYAHKAAAIDLCRADIILALRSAGSTVSPDSDSGSSPKYGESGFKPRGHGNSSYGEATTNNTVESPDGRRYVRQEGREQSNNEDPYSTENRTPPGEYSSSAPDYGTYGEMTSKYDTAISHVAPKIQELGDGLLTEVIADVEEQYGKPVPDETRRAMADHFWCELLAQMSHVLEQGLKTTEEIPKKVTELVMQERNADNRRPIEQAIVRIAVNSLWDRINKMWLSGLLLKVKITLFVMRMIAVLVCKNPERHKSVVEYCVDPLGKTFLAKTKSRLVEVFSDCVPRLKKDSGAPA